MTNQGFRFTPTNFTGVSRPDVYTDRDIVSGRPAPTPNRYIEQQVPGHPGVLEGILTIYDLSAGLGRARMPLSDGLPGFVAGELEGSPADTRYANSLAHNIIHRTFSTPVLGTTQPSDPSYRAEATNSGTSTTATGNAPVGLVAGDFMIAQVIHDDPTSTVSVVPAGWSLIHTSAPGANTGFVVRMYTKIATAADVTAGTWNWTLSNSERWRVIVAAVQDPDPGGGGGGQQKYIARARRFYFPSSGAAPSSPAYSSDWDIVTGPVATSLNKVGYWPTTPQRFLGGNIKSGTSWQTLKYEDEDLTNKDILLGQWLFGPLQAQTISAQTIKLQIQGRQFTKDDNMFLAWTAKVVSGNGLTLRGTLVNHRRDNKELFDVIEGTGDGYNRRDSTTSSAVTAQAGDYIVVELGVGGNPGSGLTDGHDARLYVGDAGANDLPEDDTGTYPQASYTPWIEFANPISLQIVEAIAGSSVRAGSLMVTMSAVNADAITQIGATSTDGSIVEELDSAANNFSVAVYSEAGLSIETATHTMTRSGGTDDMALQSVVVPPASFGKRLSHINLDGYLAIMSGDSNLMREAFNGETPVLEATGYAPASVVNALDALIIGGSDSAQRPAVSMSGDPIAILDGLSSSPSVVSSMHADTEPGWGVLNTSLLGTGTQDVMVYANAGIALGKRENAIGQTLTPTITRLPNGGGILGEKRLPNSVSRVHLLVPFQDTGSEQAEIGRTPMYVTSVNLFGDEPEDLWVPFISNGRPATFTAGAIWQNGLVLSETNRLIYHTGRNAIMGWPGERPGLAGLGQLLCRGVWVENERLQILVQRVAIFGGSGSSLYWREEFDERTGAFHQTSPIVDSETIGDIIGATSVGSLPVSSQSNVGYWHTDTEWSALYTTNLQRNPESHLRGITGGGDHQGFNASSSATTPELIPHGGAPCVLTQVRFLGNLPDDCEVNYEVTEQVASSLAFTGAGGPNRASFSSEFEWDRLITKFPTNSSFWQRCQVRASSSRGADVNQTPQMLPVEIRFLIFLDGQVRQPIQVLGSEWANSPY
jgi:hypothetical protein